MPSPTQRTGKKAEALARTFLRQQGYQFVEQNWHCRWGELDLVMKDGNELVFVEVKYRQNAQFGHPEDMVTRQKQQRLQKSALRYLREHGLDEVFWRCDIVAITGKDSHYDIHHFQDTIRDDTL